MDRLLYPPAPTHPRVNYAKLQLFLPRLPSRVPLLGHDMRRVISVSARKNGRIATPDELLPLAHFQGKSYTLTDPKSNCRKDDAISSCFKSKVISACTSLIVPAVVIFLINPLIASPAFASFHAATNTGVPAATATGATIIRSELLSSAWTGFMAGCLHTLSGPDHLAALTPLSIGRSPVESAAVGALWGCGHDAGQVIFGLLFVLLKDRLHIEILRTWGTRVVGCTLLAIGALGIKEATEVPTPCVAMEGGECEVSYYDSIGNSGVGNQKQKKIGFATFATGIVHGLQPDALMMILPALALPSRVAGAAFLVMFLVGTVVSMGSYTLFLSTCSKALKDRIPRITEKLTWASSFVAIGLGVAILVTQFFGWSLY